MDGLAVLVHGATGGVGSIATQSARRGGAQVLAVVEKVDQLARAQNLVAHHAFLADDPKLAEQLRSLAPDGVHRIADVDFAAHIDLDGDILALGGVVCSYFTSAEATRALKADLLMGQSSRFYLLAVIVILSPCVLGPDGLSGPGGIS